MAAADALAELAEGHGVELVLGHVLSQNGGLVPLSVRRVLGAVAVDDGGTILDEEIGGGAADALGGARDQGDTAREIDPHGFLPAFPVGADPRS